MGLQFKDLVVKKEISLEELRGKILAVDSMNLLYQFLTTIRGVDGAVLTDKKGRVTSHLIGLFNRTTSLMEQGIKPVFVFDGKAPEIKRKTWVKRTEVKKEAAFKLEEAREAGNVEEMRKYASRTAILTKEMVHDAQAVIAALGLPIVQAPSEGEAQTAYMVKKGHAYASVSQDYDNLIFGCPLLVRNLSIEGRRKQPGKLAYVVVKPELISLPDVLQHLALTLEQLIIVAILVGTDYNPGGIKGIGPKTALKLVKEHKEEHKDMDALFMQVEWSKHHPDITWQEIRDTIKNMPVTDDISLEWGKMNVPLLKTLLIEEHDFSAERVNKKLEALQQEQKNMAQKGLGQFFARE